MYGWCVIFFFFKQKPAYGMRISDWSSDVCSSDLDHDEQAVLARQIGSIFGAHPAATSPELVADPPEGDLPRLLAAVACALLGEGAPGGGHIFDPRHGFFGSGCPDVAVDIGFGPDRLDKVHEFMRAEGVGIDDPAPFGVDAGRAILARPDAVAPVLEIGEAAAGPAEQRHLEPPQGGEHVVAQSEIGRAHV